MSESSRIVKRESKNNCVSLQVYTKYMTAPVLVQFSRRANDSILYDLLPPQVCICHVFPSAKLLQNTCSTSPLQVNMSSGISYLVSQLRVRLRKKPRPRYSCLNISFITITFENHIILALSGKPHTYPLQEWFFMSETAHNIFLNNLCQLPPSIPGCLVRH